MAKVFSLVQTVPGLGVFPIRPPIWQDWEVTDLGSSAVVGVPPAGVPNIQAGIFNDTVAVNGLLRQSSLALPHIRGWNAPPQWFINNANYLQLINPEAGPLDFAVSVRLARAYGPAAASSIISGTATINAGVTIPIQPTAGQDWVITDVGSDAWLGAQPNGLPDVRVELTDGAIFAQLADDANVRGWFRAFELYLNRTTYLALTNTAVVPATISWSGYVARNYSPTGFSSVVSQVITLDAGGVAVIIPPVGYEMKVTDIGCSNWVPGPPGLPNVIVALTAGGIAPILQEPVNSKGWFGDMNYYLTRTNYMTLTGIPGTVVGVSAIIWKD